MKYQVSVNQIVLCEKFKHNDKGLKYFIGYKDDNIVRSLCILLPQMSGFIFCFYEDDNVLAKYNDIWNKVNKIQFS